MGSVGNPGPKLSLTTPLVLRGTACFQHPSSNLSAKLTNHTGPDRFVLSRSAAGTDIPVNGFLDELYHQPVSADITASTRQDSGPS